jgi:osmotically-inducible protein OsmY
MKRDTSDTTARFRSSSPRLFVAGDRSAKVLSVARSLETLRARVENSDWASVHPAIQIEADAMVLVEPIEIGMPAAVATVRSDDNPRQIPVYAIVSATASSRLVRDLYRSGATAVIEWPRERHLLSDILAETLGMNSVRGISRRPDTALARTIRAHLRLGPAPGKTVRVQVLEGVATLSGKARSLSTLEKIVQTAATVPGVKRVVTSELLVMPSGIPDQVVKRDLETIVRSMSEIDPEQLSIRVEGGRVTLHGRVPSRADLHDLIELAAHVKGVRDLEWEVEIASARSRSDDNTARRLERSISTLFPGQGVDVSLFGGVAVLTGVVASLRRKNEIERHCARDDGVRRIVNKLAVGGE